jgi:hypothetical protein
MSRRDKKREARQKQWEAERDRLHNLRSQAPQVKAIAWSRGFTFPFFDALDSYEAEFHKVVEEAKTTFPSLVGVFEVESEDGALAERERYGIGPDWEHIHYTCTDPNAGTYNDPDLTGNINGNTTAFKEPGGRVRTLVLIRRAVAGVMRHRDAKYVFKLIAVFHELGHVDDIEKQVNFHFDDGTADIIEAEVYAHQFALDRCNRRGLFTSADTLEDALKKYLGGADYRAEVARLVLARYQRPERKGWGEYLDGEMTADEIKLLRRLNV